MSSLFFRSCVLNSQQNNREAITMNLSLTHKIFLPMLALAGLALMVSGVAVVSLRDINAAIHITESSAQHAITQEEFARALTETVIQEKNIIIDDSDTGMAEAEKARQIWLKKAELHKQEVLAYGGDTDAINSLFGRFLAVQQKVVERGAANDNSAAAALSLGDARQARLDLLHNIDAQISHNLQLFNDMIRKTGDSYQRAMFLTIGLAAAGIVVILGSALLYIRKQVARPLLRMNQTMQEISNGNLGMTIPFIERCDQIGDMARSLAVFRDNAVKVRELNNEEEHRLATERDRTTRMAQAVTAFEQDAASNLAQLTTAATQMRATAEDMSRIAGTANDTSVRVAAATEEASANVQTVAAASEELSASISEVSSQVTQAATVSHAAVAKTQTVQVTMQKMAESVGKIGEVVNLINDIADRTNLLALNATIESARAGEAGKGFAVVAAEVKNLASQTSKATEDITRQVMGVQSSTNEAVAAIQGIVGVIENINSISATIAAAMEEQGAATQEIARNVQEAATGTREVSRNMTEVIRGADETGRSAGDVLKTSENVSENALKIRNNIESFLRDIKSA
jgi:methyl-accepting chemotaxis protein